MGTQGRDAIRFILNGQRYELSRPQVEARLADVAPEVIHKHAVRVNGTWFPAIQAFEVAIGVPRSQFSSHTARRHLATLGFEVHEEVEARTAVDGSRTPDGVATSKVRAAPVLADEGWHTEANVQAAVVTALAGWGWRILSVANTATKEHGIDVIAELEGRTVGVEVKGFPSRTYADPGRAGEAERTNPSTQAVHWFAQALLAAMRLRGKEPGWRSVIALPDFPRYRDLLAETKDSLAADQIEIWWVHADGTAIRP